MIEEAKVDNPEKDNEEAKKLLLDRISDAESTNELLEEEKKIREDILEVRKKYPGVVKANLKFEETEEYKLIQVREAELSHKLWLKDYGILKAQNEVSIDKFKSELEKLDKKGE